MLIMVQFTPIGFAKSQYKTIENMPIQGSNIADNTGELIILPEFIDGLKDLDGFSHIYVIFHLNKSTSSALQVIPFLDDKPHGIFATRSPKRPNPIGLTIVEITNIEKGAIFVKGLDLIDNTPILDIKPYIQAFDNIQNTKDGWYVNGKDPKQTLSDDRFNWINTLYYWGLLNATFSFSRHDISASSANINTISK